MRRSQHLCQRRHRLDASVMPPIGVSPSRNPNQTSVGAPARDAAPGDADLPREDADSAIEDCDGSAGGASCGDAAAPETGVLDPRLLDVWHFDWEGGRFDDIHIALCADGGAQFLIYFGATEMAASYTVIDALTVEVTVPQGDAGAPF